MCKLRESPYTKICKKIFFYMPRYASSQRSYPKFQVTYFDKAITGKFSSEYCIRDPYAKGLIRPRPFIPAS